MGGSGEGCEWRGYDLEDEGGMFVGCYGWGGGDEFLGLKECEMKGIMCKEVEREGR